MGLNRYRGKRNFEKTPEPKGRASKRRSELIFTVQKHKSRRLHYDFRLEHEGVLRSWAVPKGPSLDPRDKRLAVQVEDHPLEYATFQGEIPKGEYGAGQVEVWDFGSWKPQSDPGEALKKGHLDFQLFGKKLKGGWSLIRLRDKKGGKNNWLLFKRKDEHARPNYDVVSRKPHSVLKTRPPPDFIPFQLAQLVRTVPDGEDWIHEIKFDGYRTLCRIEGGKVKMLTRSGHDWTEKYPNIKKAAARLKVKSAILDGEIVWLDEKGHSNFQSLQNALSEKRSTNLAYYVFDLLFLNDEDLREAPLLERKRKLKDLVSGLKISPIIFSEHWSRQGPALYAQACRIGLEGLVSKRASQAYLSGRSDLWQKTKCALRQEFVIGGYTVSPSDWRSFGALLLGVYDEGQKLRYVGRVGTGFSQQTLRDLEGQFASLGVKSSPFAVKSPKGSNLRWLKPKLVAEVEFKTWTSEGLLRHPSFQGLRKDKKGGEIRVEKALRITNPERIVYKRAKIKKIQVIEYYREVAPFLLPYLEDRPLSIIRCQSNTEDACYFQKHAQGASLAGIQNKKVHYKNKRDTALTAESQGDIAQLAQGGGPLKFTPGMHASPKSRAPINSFSIWIRTL